MADEKIVWQYLGHGLSVAVSGVAKLRITQWGDHDWNFSVTGAIENHSGLEQASGWKNSKAEAKAAAEFWAKHIGT